jgi:hypothetical protein
MSDPIAISLKKHTEWFHGSPKMLQTLLTGSTITPIRILARAFSHKPELLTIDVIENNGAGKRCCTLKHNGVKKGYLYRVLVEDPGNDLVQHPTSNAANGEEMLTTKPLKLELIEEIPLTMVYTYEEDL